MKKKKDNKIYGYNEEEPMCNHCDKKLCRTRKFEQILFPQLSDLQVVKLDPLYRLNVTKSRTKIRTITRAKIVCRLAWIKYTSHQK